MIDRDMAREREKKREREKARGARESAKKQSNEDRLIRGGSAEYRTLSNWTEVEFIGREKRVLGIRF